MRPAEHSRRRWQQQQQQQRKSNRCRAGNACLPRETNPFITQGASHRMDTQKRARVLARQLTRSRGGGNDDPIEHIAHGPIHGRMRPDQSGARTG